MIQKTKDGFILGKRFARTGDKSIFGNESSEKSFNSFAHLSFISFVKFCLNLLFDLKIETTSIFIERISKKRN